MSRVVRIIAFGLGLLGAAITSQAPEFAQQYRQRIGGAIDELRRVIERFDADAQMSGETRESAIARLRGNADELASRQGVAIQAHVERLGRLEGHLQAMTQAGSFRRIGMVIREGDMDVMQAAYQEFEPALPLTEEGAISAALGFFTIWGGILLLAVFVRSLRRSRRNRIVLGS